MLELKRLRAAPMSRQHIGDIQQMHDDADLMAFLGGPRSLADTERYVERNVAHWERHGFGICVLREHETGELVGRGGLRTRDHDGEIALGFALFPRFWGRGLATEIAQSSVDYARCTLKRASVVAVTDPTNRGAQSVLVKAGLTYDCEVVEDGIPLRFYKRDLAGGAP